MNQTTNEGASPGANKAVFANCPEATIVQEAEAQFAAAVKEFIDWRNGDVRRTAGEVPDTTDHLIAGLGLSLKTGSASVESVAKFREAQKMVEAEMSQHDFRSMNEEELRRIAGPLDLRHQALQALIMRHARIAGQASTMAEELNTRFWAIQGTTGRTH